MVQYYLFMALLITTLVLWAILAIRDDLPADGAEESRDDTGEAAAGETREHA